MLKKNQFGNMDCFGRKEVLGARGTCCALEYAVVPESPLSPLEETDSTQISSILL
jgi:hypothetical protein